MKLQRIASGSLASLSLFLVAYFLVFRVVELIRLEVSGGRLVYAVIVAGFLCSPAVVALAGSALARRGSYVWAFGLAGLLWTPVALVTAVLLGL